MFLLLLELSFSYHQQQLKSARGKLIIVCKIDKAGSWAASRFLSVEQLKFGASVNGVLFFGQKYDSSNQSPGCGPVALIHVIPIGKKEARIRIKEVRGHLATNSFYRKGESPQDWNWYLTCSLLLRNYLFLSSSLGNWSLNLPDTGVAMNIDSLKIVTPPVI